MRRVALLGLATLAIAQIPAEIEHSPDGNLVINLGGLPEHRFIYQQSDSGIFRARARGVPTEPKAGVRSAAKLAEAAAEAAQPDYDYEGFGAVQQVVAKDGSKPSKRAKSNRGTVLDLLGTAPAREGVPRVRPYVDSDLPAAANHAAFMGPRDGFAVADYGVASVNNGGCGFRDNSTSRAQAAPTVPVGVRSRPQAFGALVSEASLSPSYTRGGRPAGAPYGRDQPPLPECYETQPGMLCCNRVVEELIYQASDLMVHRNQNKCNIGIYSDILRNLAETEFQTSFEVVVANGDFAAKLHFRDNLMCKSVVNAKYVLIYATPVEYDLRPENAKPPLSA